MARPRKAECIAAFLVGFLVATSFLLGSPPPRAHAGSCEDNAFTNIGVKRDRMNRGVRVVSPGMLVANGNVECERVSSIFVLVSFDTYVEFGWLERTFPNQCGQVQNGNDPTRLAIWSVNGTCFTNDAVVPPKVGCCGQVNYTISNTDHDNDYEFFIKGVRIGQTANTTFPDGFTVVNTERTLPDQNAYGRFDEVDHQTSTGWGRWQEVAELCDTDNLYDWYEITGEWDIEIKQPQVLPDHVLNLRTEESGATS